MSNPAENFNYFSWESKPFSPSRIILFKEIVDHFLHALEVSLRHSGEEAGSCYVPAILVLEKPT